MQKYIVYIGVIIVWLMALYSQAFAQNLRIERETVEFTDYVFTNDSLKIVPPEMLLVPFRNGEHRYRLLEQDLVRVNSPKMSSFSSDEEMHSVIPDTQHSLTETFAPFEHRKQWKSNLALNVARKDINQEDAYLIARTLRIRVFKDKTWTESASSEPSTFSFEDTHPLSSGAWYRFPVTQNGIYRLNRDFFSSLGISVESVDPRNIQFWGTNGYELPKANADERPSWTQIPVIFEGESNGSFDADDYVLIYGNDVNESKFDVESQTWVHNVHDYATENYIYITVGTERGDRLQPAQITGTPSQEITSFRDFLWKEEELFKPEARLRSGTQWFGQQFTPEFSNQVIFRDTLAGFIPGSIVEFQARLGARSQSTSSFTITSGSVEIGSLSISGIQQLTGETGQSSRVGNITRQVSNITLNNDILEIRAQYSFSATESRGWIDFIKIRADRSLRANNGVLFFHAPDEETANPVVDYSLSGFSSRPVVLDITDAANPVLIQASSSGNNWMARYYGQQGTKLLAQSRFLSPLPGEEVQNQNLHAINFFPDYIIVTNDTFLEPAQELADYRAQKNGLRPLIVTQQQIFHEYSGGVPDPVAIRDFIRHLWLKAGQNEENLIKYLVFFGNTTFDFKAVQSTAPIQNQVFTFQHYNDIDNLLRQGTYGSDDFFTFMGEDEGSWQRTDRNNRLDFGVGRLPVKTVNEANLLIDKIKVFEDPDNRGDWRTVFTFTADDAVNGRANDRDLHTFNADVTAETIDTDATGIRLRKVYQFSYPVENTPGGQRVPQATEDFVRAINSGTLTIHYSGHGNEQQLTAQRLFQSSDIARLNNANKPTILVTATCSFGRFDDNNEVSGAEQLILHTNGGAVAAMTTTRVVYTGTSLQGDNNFALHVQLTRQMVEKDANGQSQTLGDIFMHAKNAHLDITSNNTTSVNNRKFVLLGDPAMNIGVPDGRIEVTEINGLSNLADVPIQIRALDQVQIAGHVVDANGNVNTGFNGIGNVRVFDARRLESIPNPQQYCWLLENCGFLVQNDVLYNGRVSITNGSFNTEFIVPKDIAYSDSSARIHVYALNPSTSDAAGSFSNFYLNGTNPDADNVFDGPQLDVYLNDDTFMNGSLVNTNPDLIVDIESEAGVNITGAGVGHEAIAILRNEDNPGDEQTFILNDFYESELDNFRRGQIRYPISGLTDGTYSLTVRAWDVFNNVGESEVFFKVSGGDDLTLQNVANYPNPMHNFTRFAFEHNMSIGQPYDVFIRIFTLSGKPVAQIRQSDIAQQNLTMIEWNGRDDDNNRLAAGTYLYHLRVKTEGPNGRQTVEKIERLVIIR